MISAWWLLLAFAVGVACVIGVTAIMHVSDCKKHDEDYRNY
jgi:hypothetical protein